VNIWATQNHDTGPEYTAERSVWWEEGMKAVIIFLNKFPSLDQIKAEFY